jgi:hypothetical protein
MKRLFTILLAAALLLALSGCLNTRDITIPTKPAQATTTAPANTAGITPFALLKASYAWAVRDGDWETPGTRLAAVEYAGKLEKLTLAAGADTLFPVKYEGEKQATGENWEYGATYEGITGPHWSAEVPLSSYNYLLLPEACKDGLLAFTPGEAEETWEGGGFDFNHGHPPADPADVEAMEAFKKGRAVLHSELLATDENGGRVSLFQYENRDEGLLVLAYINGDRVVTQEFTAGVYEDGAAWRADAEGDDICVFELVTLCETDAGLVIAYLWYGPEGTGKWLVKEDGGAFAEFETDIWSYNHWEDKFYQAH